MEATKAGQKAVPCTWVLRVERNPAGEIIKRKARICLRGDLMDQTKDDFAPAVAWHSARFFLVVSPILGWKTAFIDFNNAFVQTPSKEPICMTILRGFRGKCGHN